jgi:hypothetical protein
MAQSPFPGMDPYLEDPTLWQGVHGRLINILADQLTPLIAPKYIADFETEIVIDRIRDDSLEGWGARPPERRGARPDVSVIQLEPAGPTPVAIAPVTPPSLRLTAPMAMPTRLVTLQVRERETDKLVTAIELLSPINKRPGNQRQKYLEKRMDYLESDVHFVEIDLLRRWPRMPLEEMLPACDYVAIVCNAYERPACDVWAIDLRQSLPILPIPLLKPDPAVPLDLGLAVRTVYERGRYDLRIDYNRPSDPPLAKEDVEWAAALLEK